MAFPFVWALCTVAASLAQTFRNAMQRDLTKTLGALGATHVRFLFGLPFALVFLALVHFAGGQPLPRVGAEALAWTALGAISQIVATAMMLEAMQARSFVVTIAYTKTEPVQVALFALVFLGERVAPLALAGVLVATAGVMIMSWPRRGVGGAAEPDQWKAVALGVASGGFFALSAVGFRGGIINLGEAPALARATTTLVLGLAMQTVLLSLWLAAREPGRLGAILRAWRRAGPAGFMGALASQFWFFAFALTSVANVRTLALVEVFFAHIVSRNVFLQGVSRRERVGMILILAGVVLLLRG